MIVAGTALTTLVDAVGTARGLLLLSRVAYGVGFSAGGIGAIALR